MLDRVKRNSRLQLSENPNETAANATAHPDFSRLPGSVPTQSLRSGLDSRQEDELPVLHRLEHGILVGIALGIDGD